MHPVYRRVPLKVQLSLEQVDDNRSGEARAEAGKARLTTGAKWCIRQGSSKVKHLTREVLPGSSVAAAGGDGRGTAGGGAAGACADGAGTGGRARAGGGGGAGRAAGRGDRGGAASVAPHRLPVGTPLRAAGTGRLGGSHAQRPPTDLSGRARGRDCGTRADQAQDLRMARCLVDARPPSRHSRRAEGHHQEAQPTGRSALERGLARGLARGPSGDVVWRARRPRLCGQTGAIAQLYTPPPQGSVVVCLDERGPAAAKSGAGAQRIAVPTRPGARAKQEIDYGRRGTGAVFGAFQPARGAAQRSPGPPRAAPARIASPSWSRPTRGSMRMCSASRLSATI